MTNRPESYLSIPMAWYEEQDGDDQELLHEYVSEDAVFLRHDFVVLGGYAPMVRIYYGLQHQP